MQDGAILSHIEKLSIEEQELEESHHGSALSKDQLTRLKTLEIELDQAYDLLRQRRARRSAGQSPDLASERKPDVVENYLQ
jgi:hypothetical protein